MTNKPTTSKQSPLTQSPTVRKKEIAISLAPKPPLQRRRPAIIIVDDCQAASALLNWHFSSAFIPWGNLPDELADFKDDHIPRLYRNRNIFILTNNAHYANRYKDRLKEHTLPVQVLTLPASMTVEQFLSNNDNRKLLRDKISKAQGDPMPPEFLDDVEEREVEWLWPNRIPFAELTLLVGDPGVGKSILSLNIAARVSTGKSFPCDPPDKKHKPAGVALMCSEDNPSTTVKPRFIAAGGDSQKVILLDLVRDSKGDMRPFTLSTGDAARLNAQLAYHPDVRLIILDSLDAYLGIGDDHSGPKMRHALSPLVTIARDHNLAVLIVHHLRKGASSLLQEKSIYQVKGSIGFVAAARMVWGV